MAKQEISKILIKLIYRNKILKKSSSSFYYIQISQQYTLTPFIKIPLIYIIDFDPEFLHIRSIAYICLPINVFGMTCS